MRKGYITVYFSIVLLVCMSLFIGLIYGARENAIRVKIVETADTAIRSSFGEYEKELWKRYNLIFVDAADGYETNSLIIPEDHLINCFNENFDEEMFGLFGGRDLLKLHCYDVQTESIRFATDDGGAPVYRQAVDFYSKSHGIGYLEEIFEEVNEAEENGLFDETLEVSLDETVEELEKKDAPVLKEWTKAANEAIFEEKELSTLSTLKIVLKDISGLSKVSLNKNTFPEARECNVGNFETDENFGITNDLIFKEYVLAYCGNYLSENTDTVLKYESEYLIKGNTKDTENLEGVVNRLLIIREAANMETLISDSEKMSEIKAFAETLTGILLAPEAEPELETLIIALMAFTESICDVRILLDGEKVPLIKTPDQWKTSMADIFTGNTARAGYEEGLSYKDYLRMFLYFIDTKTVLNRFLNICEANVRKDTDNNSFRLDNCFDAWEVTAYITSDFGYSYTVTRKMKMEE